MTYRLYPIGMVLGHTSDLTAENQISFIFPSVITSIMILEARRKEDIIPGFMVLDRHCYLLPS